jgi:hypothetical protein
MLPNTKDLKLKKEKKGKKKKDRKKQLSVLRT